MKPLNSTLVEQTRKIHDHITINPCRVLTAYGRAQKPSSSVGVISCPLRSARARRYTPMGNPARSSPHAPTLQAKNSSTLRLLTRLFFAAFSPNVTSSTTCDSMRRQRRLDVFAKRAPFVNYFRKSLEPLHTLNLFHLYAGAPTAPTGLILRAPRLERPVRECW